MPFFISRGIFPYKPIFRSCNFPGRNHCEMNNINHFQTPSVLDQNDPGLKLSMKQAQVALDQTQIALEQTQIALEQTRFSRKQHQLAMERTHLAWTRTLVVLMAVGFTINTLTGVLSNNRILPEQLFLPIRAAGLLMVVTGIILSSTECIRYIRRYYRSLHMDNIKSAGPMLETILSLLNVVIGIIYTYTMLSSIFY